MRNEESMGSQSSNSTARSAQPDWQKKSFKVRLYREDLNFSAGHISTYGDEVEGQHGHNYQLSIELEGTVDRDCLVIDFRTVKAILRSIIKRLNHKTLVPTLHPRLQIDRRRDFTRITLGDQHLEFPTDNLAFLELPNMTSEMLAYYITSSILDQLPAEDSERLCSIKVEVIESPGQSASYQAEVS